KSQRSQAFGQKIKELESLADSKSAPQLKLMLKNAMKEGEGGLASVLAYQNLLGSMGDAGSKLTQEAIEEVEESGDAKDWTPMRVEMGHNMSDDLKRRNEVLKKWSDASAYDTDPETGEQTLINNKPILNRKAKSMRDQNAAVMADIENMKIDKLKAQSYDIKKEAIQSGNLTTAQLSDILNPRNSSSFEQDLRDMVTNQIAGRGHASPGGSNTHP
ncbi:MAG TPA: hypothetical protein VFQ70_02225, partial [Candidatus Saccharimonadaceae bacterium]|nr:hypothetical protein [Candidatus Saccharimonadaceae bacterium]